MKFSRNINELSTKIRPDEKMIIYEKNMGLFLAQLCMFITSQKTFENSIPFEHIFFNTFLKVSQKNKCISIVVLLVFSFKNASRLFKHPIYLLLLKPAHSYSFLFELSSILSKHIFQNFSKE